MEPIKFPGYNVVIAKDQREYLPLPAFHSQIFNNADTRGNVISCWRLSIWERLKVLFSGRVYLSQMTFGGPLQPQRPYVENPLTPEAKAAGISLDAE